MVQNHWFCLRPKNAKNPTPHKGEMELRQRTDQLAIVSWMGRGTPIPAKLLSCSRGVKDAVLSGISTEIRGRRSERSEVRVRLQI